MKINVIKKLGVLKPVDELDQKELFNLKDGQIYSCEIKKPRNIGYHRKFFAMLNLCFDNQDVFNSLENFRKEMLKASGYFNSYVNHKNITVYEAKSISFSNMSQDEFQEVYEAVFMTILTVFKWTESEDQFRVELNEFI